MNTTITTESKTLPKLVKGQSTYKLIVPQDVEEKIRYLLRKFPSTEWSGVLFITHDGSFETNDLVITCKDIYPMDLGNSTFTEFKMNEDVAAYMAQNIELFDCEIGLVHSHHQMSTNPSGTDLNTLREEGNERNCFVSLIVNNAGTYYAAITRKVQSKSEVTVKSLGTSYEFFGEGSKTVCNNGTEVTKTVDKEYIEYFDLQIERHEVPNALSYLDTRFEEIEKKKKDTPKTSSVYYPQTYTNQSKSETNDVQFFEWLHPAKIRDGSEQQTSLDFEDTQKQDTSKMETTYDWTPDPKKIYDTVVHIVTLNLILDPKNFNFNHWVTRHMSNVYQKVFGKTCAKGNLPAAFCEWRDFIIQFTLDHYDEPNVPTYMYDEYDIFTSVVAQSLIDELSKYKDLNPYIQEYIDLLYQYIV